MWVNLYTAPAVHHINFARMHFKGGINMCLGLALDLG